MALGTERTARLQAILELVRTRTFRSQSALREALADLGMGVNQGTLSRDLRDLGVRKGPLGYEPPEGVARVGMEAALTQALTQWLVSAVAAQNQVVIRTPPGGAQPLAVALDRATLPALLGTVAGDDTVLAITPDSVTARELADQILAWIGK